MELKQKVGIQLKLSFIVNYVMCERKIVIINIFHKYFCIYIIIFYNLIIIVGYVSTLYIYFIVNIIFFIFNKFAYIIKI